MGERRKQFKGRAPELGTDEVPDRQWNANHTRGQMAVGGRLWLTTSRLVFVPNVFERGVMRRSEWSCRLADVTDVGVASRGIHPFNGAWRRRLVVHHSDGAGLFVVNHVEDVVGVIRQALTGNLHRPE
jgi:hypothetical protein